eukprot:4137896-Alexandrium_andersonii.AAC.1
MWSLRAENCAKGFPRRLQVTKVDALPGSAEFKLRMPEAVVRAPCSQPRIAYCGLRRIVAQTGLGRIADCT